MRGCSMDWQLTLYLQAAHGIQDGVEVGITVGGGAVGDLFDGDYIDIYQQYQEIST